MRKILYAIAWMLSALFVQAADITPVANAFKAGDADILKNNMASEVDLVTPDASKKGSGNEAIVLLKSFFQSHKPTGFTVAHHADKNESGFLVGKLTTADGVFRVNINYTTKDGKIFITIIRIE